MVFKILWFIVYASECRILSLEMSRKREGSPLFLIGSIPISLNNESMKGLMQKVTLAKDRVRKC